MSKEAFLWRSLLPEQLFQKESWGCFCMVLPNILRLLIFPKPTQFWVCFSNLHLISFVVNRKLPVLIIVFKDLKPTISRRMMQKRARYIVICYNNIYSVLSASWFCKCRNKENVSRHDENLHNWKRRLLVEIPSRTDIKIFLDS